jgi:hypothetical protein
MKSLTVTFQRNIDWGFIFGAQLIERTLCPSGTRRRVRLTYRGSRLRYAERYVVNTTPRALSVIAPAPAIFFSGRTTCQDFQNHQRRYYTSDSIYDIGDECHGETRTYVSYMSQTLGKCQHVPDIISVSPGLETDSHAPVFHESYESFIRCKWKDALRP